MLLVVHPVWFFLPFCDTLMAPCFAKNSGFMHPARFSASQMFPSVGCRGRVHGFAESSFSLQDCSPAYKSCPALNLSTGFASRVNYSTVPCFTSVIYILPVTIWVIRAFAAWWCSLRPADFLFNDTVLFSASDRISFCLRSHYLPAESGMIYPRKQEKHFKLQKHEKNIYIIITNQYTGLHTCSHPEETQSKWLNYSVPHKEKGC